MGGKHCLAGELWLDQQLLRTMENASSLKQKVSEIFDLLRDRVYRYLFRILGDPGEAEDRCGTNTRRRCRPPEFAPARASGGQKRTAPRRAR